MWIDEFYAQFRNVVRRILKLQNCERACLEVSGKVCVCSLNESHLCVKQSLVCARGHLAMYSLDSSYDLYG